MKNIMWENSDIGYAPSDHRRCLLEHVMPGSDWVWVDFDDAAAREKLYNRNQVIAYVRHHLSSERGQRIQALVLLTSIFWDPDRPPSAHEIRNLHCNDKNWPLIPYVPVEYRCPWKYPWGSRFRENLCVRGLVDAYQHTSMCPHCHQRP